MTTSRTPGQAIRDWFSPKPVVQQSAAPQAPMLDPAAIHAGAIRAGLVPPPPVLPPQGYTPPYPYAGDPMQADRVAPPPPSFRDVLRQNLGMPNGLPPSGNGMPGTTPSMGGYSPPAPPYPYAGDPMQASSYGGTPTPPNVLQAYHHALTPPGAGPSLPQNAPLPPVRPQMPPVAPSMPYATQPESAWIDPSILAGQNTAALGGGTSQPGDGLKGFHANGGPAAYAAMTGGAGGGGQATGWTPDGQPIVSADPQASMPSAMKGSSLANFMQLVGMI